MSENTEEASYPCGHMPDGRPLYPASLMSMAGWFTLRSFTDGGVWPTSFGGWLMVHSPSGLFIGETTDGIGRAVVAGTVSDECLTFQKRYVRVRGYNWSYSFGPQDSLTGIRQGGYVALEDSFATGTSGVTLSPGIPNAGGLLVDFELTARLLPELAARWQDAVNP